MSTLSCTVVNESVREIKDRECRQNNLLFFNIPESDHADPEKRKEHDEQHLKLVWDKLGVEAIFHKITRLGQKSDKSWPTRVTVTETTQLGNILKSAHKLREDPDSILSNVSVKRDAIPLERKEMKILTQEKYDKKLESEQKNEKANWVIRRGKVINRRTDLWPLRKKRHRTKKT